MEQPIETLRRARCEAGRREGQLIMQTLPSMSESERTQAEVRIAQRLAGSTGLDHNYLQGVFYEAVPNIPLNFLLQASEGVPA